MGPEVVTLKEYMVETTRGMGFTGLTLFLYAAAAEWLAEEGYLVSSGQEAGGSFQLYAVTPKGSKIGLLEGASRKGKKNSICLQGEWIQGFLYGSIDKIMAFERRQWEPLLRCLTPEWQAQASVLPEAATLTALARQIGSQLPAGLSRKFTVKRAFCWLERKGLVEDAFANGRMVHWPTIEGRRLGMSLDAKNRTILFSVSAQKFIIDNLESIVRDLASGEAYRLGPDPRKLTGAQAAQAKIQAVPNELSVFALEDMINEALASLTEKKYKLARGVVRMWLFANGYVKNVKIEGSDKKAPRLTDAGEAAGIRIQPNNYIVFGEAAQSFTAKHLSEIWDLYREHLNGEESS